MRPKNILLIRPPLYEVIPSFPEHYVGMENYFEKFSTFASQPAALVRIGTYLKTQGHIVQLIDCAAEVSSDYEFSIHNKSLVALRSVGMRISNGPKYPVYLRGLNYAAIKSRLQEYKDIDEVYITSCMTYHWEPVHEVAKICKSIYPDAKVIIGGIYATLCPEHAAKSYADQVFTGDIPEANNIEMDMSIFPYAPNHIILKSTRGCPNDCSYCAVPRLEGRCMQYREPKSIVDEIAKLKNEHGIMDFYFWESNILVNAKRHFELILDGIISSKLNIHIGIPEGIDPRLLYPELAKKMKLAGMTKVSLALETSDENIAKNRFNRNTTVKTFDNAVDQLLAAGFEQRSIKVFILAGMPNQDIKCIMDSMLKVMERGCQISIMPFTPIPGTREYMDYYHLISGKGLEELHPYLFPFADEKQQITDLIDICYFNNYLYDAYDTLIRLNEGRVKEYLSRHIKKKLFTFFHRNVFSYDRDISGTLHRAVESGFLDGCNDNKLLEIEINDHDETAFPKYFSLKKQTITVSENGPANFTKADIILDLEYFSYLSLNEKKEYIGKIHEMLRQDGKLIIRCFSEHCFSSQRLFPDVENSKIRSPFVYPLNKDTFIKILSPLFSIENMFEIFHTAVDVGSASELVPSVYEACLKKK